MSLVLAAIGNLFRQRIVGAGWVIGVVALAAFSGLIALGWVAAALMVLLAESYGTVVASLIMAGGFALLALILLIVGAVLRARARQRARQLAMIQGAAALAPALLRANPVATLALVAAAAHILARRI
ncbi:hypothetical protein [Rhizobium alvei]|uniref:Phage holin family protein n=1 Tax=Rhizobium alvei TaxID=1132659 RepID=A0ABT8YNI6_9HYPH|nr:hypothetical protein [Rhizobium alvei]MDO6965207.1 hypothetical protein [Rhizobium alvei]